MLHRQRPQPLVFDFDAEAEAAQGSSGPAVLELHRLGRQVFGQEEAPDRTLDETGRPQGECQVPARCREDGRLADESIDIIEEACEEALDGLSRRKRLDDDTVETVLVRAVRKACEKTFGRKPLVDVTIMRV